MASASCCSASMDERRCISWSQRAAWCSEALEREQASRDARTTTRIGGRRHMGADVWLIVNRQPTQPCAQLELFIERFNSKELHTRGGDGGNCMLKAVEVTFVNILQSHVTLHSNFILGNHLSQKNTLSAHFGLFASLSPTSLLGPLSQRTTRVHNY